MANAAWSKHLSTRLFKAGAQAGWQVAARNCDSTPFAVQDESADTACSDGISSDVAKKLRPQLDEKELAVALKQGPVAGAKVSVACVSLPLWAPVLARLACLSK